MVTVVGQCVGANDYQAAQHYTKKLMKLSYLCTAVLGTAVCLCLPLLLQFYELSASTCRFYTAVQKQRNGPASPRPWQSTRR